MSVPYCLYIGFKGPLLSMLFTLLLHNAKATHSSWRFTHPNKKIMCAVHIGTTVSGEGEREGSGAGPTNWEDFKAPDNAQEKPRHVTDLKLVSAERGGSSRKSFCCRGIIIPLCFWLQALTCDTSWKVSSLICLSSRSSQWCSNDGFACYRWTFVSGSHCEDVNVM